MLKYPNRATEISYQDFALHLHTNTIGPIICAQALLALDPTLSPDKIIFMSSDSGSTALFRDFEDGFGAYAASKAALNQMLRHMAAELKRKGRDVCVLAMVSWCPAQTVKHCKAVCDRPLDGNKSSRTLLRLLAILTVLVQHPGEVSTWVILGPKEHAFNLAYCADRLHSDMANIELDWDVDGLITAKESVTGMLQVIDKKGKDDTGTFWCWDGRVRHSSSNTIAFQTDIVGRNIPGSVEEHLLWVFAASYDVHCIDFINISHCGRLLQQDHRHPKSSKVVRSSTFGLIALYNKHVEDQRGVQEM